MPAGGITVPEPGSPEWKQRLASILAEEGKHPEWTWFLSFAGEEGFRGAVITRARGMTLAIRRANEMGINPGGEVLSFSVPAGEESCIPADMYDRLLRREELLIRLTALIELIETL
jgi:hypothetical protein